MILSPITAFGNTLVPAVLPTLQPPTAAATATPASAPGLFPTPVAPATSSATAAVAALAAAQQQNPFAAAIAAAGLAPTANGLISPAASYFEGTPIYLWQNPMAAATTPFVMPKIPDISLNSTSSPTVQPRVDTSKHSHIFVGDLSSEIDNKALKEAFTQFGEISEVKVIRDLQTLKSKGYGFVTFVKREDAERAIEQMNGQWLGRRTIRTNWASRKLGNAPSSITGSYSSIAKDRDRDRDRDRSNGDQSSDDCGPPPARRRMIKCLTFEEIMSQASPMNSTVYVGGISAAVTDDDLKQTFGKFGTITETRVFRQQGYAFVKYDQKESAANAIFNTNNTEINGCHIKCSWGKESGASTLLNYNLAFNLATAAGGGLGNIWSQYYPCYNNTTLAQQWQMYWQQQQQVNAANGLLLNTST